MIEYQERLRSLALSNDRFVDTVLGMGRDTVEISRLDPKTHALVNLAALLAVDAAQSSYNAGAEVALATGATVDEIVGWSFRGGPCDRPGTCRVRRAGAGARARLRRRRGARGATLSRGRPTSHLLPNG